MIPRHLYWFLYRRRNKLLIILLFIIIIIFFFYESSNDSSSAYSKAIDRPKRDINQKKIRVNRETYQIPEPCPSCPGENGGGVSLTVIECEEFNSNCLV
jgi:hypothetical protein